jgi:hypothetical protein
VPKVVSIVVVKVTIDTHAATSDITSVAR